jgi:hypothetical protein
MNPQISLAAAQSHQHDLHRAAQRSRLAAELPRRQGSVSALLARLAAHRGAATPTSAVAAKTVQA